MASTLRPFNPARPRGRGYVSPDAFGSASQPRILRTLRPCGEAAERIPQEVVDEEAPFPLGRLRSVERPAAERQPPRAEVAEAPRPAEPKRRRRRARPHATAQPTRRGTSFGEVPESPLELALRLFADSY